MGPPWRIAEGGFVEDFQLSFPLVVSFLSLCSVGYLSDASIVFVVAIPCSLDQYRSFSARHQACFALSNVEMYLSPIFPGHEVSAPTGTFMFSPQEA